MGMDLYGLNPKGKVKQPKEGEPDNYGDVWHKDYRAWQEAEGTYFRNNVWWWRPLADYVINHTGCVDEKDREGWHCNSGHKVSEAEANAIADQLEHLLKTGHTETFAHDYEEERKEMEEHNNKIQKLEDKLMKQVEKETGNPNIAPISYPADRKKEWDELQAKRKWGASYPFSIENVKEFISFCRCSGGFEIC